jgi:DNA-binding beta-propeller fold protein YncE
MHFRLRKYLAIGAIALITSTVASVALVPVPLAGASGALEFDGPSGLAFGGGHLWVTNQAGNSVTEINPNGGAWIATFIATRFHFNQPTAITSFGPDLFVANAGGSISELRASDGALIRVISGKKYGFDDPIAVTAVGKRILVLNAGLPSASPSVTGSITELNGRTGALLRTISGPSLMLDNPMALTMNGADVYVADEANNSVTVANIATGNLVTVISQQGLDNPDGIAYQDGNVWVADSASNAATEISATTNSVTTTETDSDGAYGFGDPLMVIGTDGNVYVASPYGTSPMVTKVSATSGTPYWFMCNTNGPYYFSQLSAFAVSGDDLWVASRSGANSETPGASTGSLTEMSVDDGSLITTLPLPG